MVITPVTSTSIQTSAIDIPPAALPDAPQVQHAFQAITTLSLNNDPHAFSNLATLSFLQGQVGQASARAILDATVSYQKTSLYGSGLTPAALAISDQLSDLYRQIQEQQRLLRDQIAASDAAAQSAWDSGNFWGYVTNAAASLTGLAQLLFNEIAGFFVSAAAVVASFFETCFSSWFRADEDAQSALFIGGTNDPQNVFVEDQSLKILVPGLDPVKDLPNKEVSALRNTEELMHLRDPDYPGHSVVTPANADGNNTSGDIPSWLPGFIDPYQSVGDSQTRQSLLQGLQSTRRADQMADMLATEGADVMDLAVEESLTVTESASSGPGVFGTVAAISLPGVSPAQTVTSPAAKMTGHLPADAGSFPVTGDLVAGNEIEAIQSTDAVISRSERLMEEWSEIRTLGSIEEEALQIVRKDQADQLGVKRRAVESHAAG